MSKSRPPADCIAVRRWISARLGQQVFGVFTGQDSRAFSAAVHLIELYAVSDHSGREAAIGGLRATLKAMQTKCRFLVREAIPAVMDWGDVATLWPQISEAGDDGETRPVLRTVSA